MNKLSFLISTNGIYNNFISPFIFFANYTNSNSNFIIYITDEISQNLKQQINFLKTLNISITIINKKYKINPLYLRFLIEPQQKTQYTYIGDSDILICQPILDFHLNQMKKFNNLYYDNVTREYQNKPTNMSGLHFIKSKEWYQKTKIVRQKLFKEIQDKPKKGDQYYLYDICNESNIFINYNCQDKKSFNIARPIHGIHLSLNRIPFKKQSKSSVSHLGQYKEKFLQIILTKQFQYLLTLNSEFQKILNTYKQWEKF